MEAAKLQRKLKEKGVNFMLITPFFENEEVDYDGFRNNIRFLLDKIKDFKSCMITPAGSNGEFVHLCLEEHKKIIKICVEEVNGKVPVIAGTGKASTYETIKLSQYAQEVGADGVQVILPYYFIPTEEGMYEHYKTLAESINIGIIIYNNPAFSKSWMKPRMVLKLIEECDGKIVGIKENTPHLMLFDSMVKALEKTGISVYSGFGEQWYAYQFPWGADGLATPFGNFFPEYPINVFKASQKFDFSGLKGQLKMMEPYYSFVARCSTARGDTGIMVKPGGNIYGEGNVRFGVIKEAMNLMGLCGGYMRKPLLGINDKERGELKEILKALKLL